VPAVIRPASGDVFVDVLVTPSITLLVTYVLVAIENPTGKFVRVRFVDPVFVVAKNRSAPLFALI
jgi:hypothetical protein